MKHSTMILPFVFCAAAALSYGQTPPQADNTQVNKRDQKAGAVTADQQKMNAADQNLTRTIRRSIIADKSLSTYAHNIKIITQDGVVTLKGPVWSNAEKEAVVAKAVTATGSSDKVSDQISIKK